MNTASPAFAGAILALEMEAALMIIQYMVVWYDIMMHWCFFK
jgi:hypothetical protein